MYCTLLWRRHVKMCKGKIMKLDEIALVCIATFTYGWLKKLQVLMKIGICHGYHNIMSFFSKLLYALFLCFYLVNFFVNISNLIIQPTIISMFYFPFLKIKYTRMNATRQKLDMLYVWLAHVRTTILVIDVPNKCIVKVKSKCR